jgi:multiple antibiotic resistance protein
MTFFSIAVILFLLMDPIGNISSFISQLEDVDPKRRKLVIVREMLIALVIMVLFNYLGEAIFNILNVSSITVRLASGTILFLVAIKILFPATDSLRANLPKGEPFITPLAVPLTAGPSLIATIMLFASLESSQMLMLSAILAAWAAALAIHLIGPILQKYLGNNGLMACERLMGMVLVLLAIQRFLEGIQEFVKCCR